MKKIFLFLFFIPPLFISSCQLPAYAPFSPPAHPYTPVSNGDQQSYNTPNNLNNQNLASTGQPGAPNTVGQAATRTNELPYDLTPDFITALTCSQNVSFGSGHYSLSLSSHYEGLQLAQGFKEAHELDSNRRRPTNAEKARIMRALNNSPLKTAVAELSIRSRGNIYSPYQINSSPIISYFPVLNTNYILSQLSQNSKVLSTRPVNSSRYNSSPFRANLNNVSTGLFTQHIAPNLFQSSGDYMLTLLYRIQQRDGQGPPISNAEGKPHGKSYTLNFNSGRSVDYLTDIYEEELQSSRQGQGWSCPSDLRFMVHKNESRTDSRYNKDAAGTYSHLGLSELEVEGYCDVNDRNALTKRQRDFLSLEFGENEGRWPFKVGSSMVGREGSYVKLSGAPCIVIPAGRGACYPDDDTSFYRVEFDTNWLNSCKRTYDFSTSDRDYTNLQSAGVYRVCPAWLSMCYRDEE